MLRRGGKRIRMDEPPEDDAPPMTPPASEQQEPYTPYNSFSYAPTSDTPLYQMDCLECNICHVPYDEGLKRPRYAPCGHYLCTACFRVLIKNGIFICPNCRQKNKVDVAENLPICYGLIDVIREYKTKQIPLAKETEPGISRASNYEVCKVHHKSIEHRCLKCQLWICEECLEFHSTLLGCSTISTSNAMNSMKMEHNEVVNRILTSFKDDINYVSSKIQDLTNKKKYYLEMAEKHGKELEELHKLVKQGNIHKDKLVESWNDLNATNSPFSMMDKIEMLTQRKHFLHSWSVKNKENHLNKTSPKTLISLLKALEEGNVIYSEMVIKHEKRHAKLSHQKGKIYYHFFRTQTVADANICMPCAQLQKMIPEEPSLVFLELSLDDVVKGYVLVRLDKSLPKIRANIVHIVTAQCGPTLAGAVFDHSDCDGIAAWDLPLSEVPVNPDRTGRTIGKRGAVIGYYVNGYFQDISFFLARPPKTYNYDCDHRLLGHIEAGLDVVQYCYDNYNRERHNVKITDCGLVIEQE